MKKKLAAIVLVLLIVLSGCSSNGGTNYQYDAENSTPDTSKNDSKVVQTASIHKGQYIGGKDIPAGSYQLTRLGSGSGIVWLSSPEDNLDENYPSLIYEYIGPSDDASFFISLQEEGALETPFDCELTIVDYSRLKEGESIPAAIGTYTGGLDLPAGQYLLEYDETNTGSGIIWLSDPDDDLENEYPGRMYEFVNAGKPGKWFISLEDGGKLYVPFVCESITRIAPIMDAKEKVELYAGLYVIGSDIAPGRYNITCSTNGDNAGIVWASSPGDDLDNEYPSVLYEYIGYNRVESFYINLEEGARLYLPCDAIIEPDGIVFN